MLLLALPRTFDRHDHDRKLDFVHQLHRHRAEVLPGVAGRPVLPDHQ